MWENSGDYGKHRHWVVNKWFADSLIPKCLDAIYRGQIHNKLPKIMELWGKVCIKNVGETVKWKGFVLGSSMWLQFFELLARNNKINRLLQYEIAVEIENLHGGDPITHKTIFYSKLEKILVCKLPNNIFWDLGGATCILTLIISCNTKGCDATIEMTTYTTTAASIITNLHSIKEVVGLIES